MALLKKYGRVAIARHAAVLQAGALSPKFATWLGIRVQESELYAFSV